MKNRDLYHRIINNRLDKLRAVIDIHVQDAREYHALSRILTEINPQVIVHLAAVAHAGTSNKDPYSTFDHSLRTLENALDWSRGTLEQFIFFSSSMVYGNFLTEEVSEDHPLNPMGIYGALKVASEKMVIAYQQVFDLPYTIRRRPCTSGCVNGAWARSLLRVRCRVVLRSMAMAANSTSPFIEDLVEGVCLAIQHPDARNVLQYDPWVIATYSGYGRDQEHFPQVEVERVARDKLMPFRGTLSVDKARSRLGYDPKHPLEIGLPKYINWYKSLNYYHAPSAAIA